MNTIKSTWTSITGSISSIIPMFFTVCKSGVCTAACASPIASLLGLSTASLVASPLVQSLFPLLLVLSAISFTVSYYKLYVLPKYASANSCSSDCGCITPKKTFQQKFSLYTFWIGLLASTFFFSYYEYQNYKSNKESTLAVNSKNTNTEDNTSDAAVTDTNASESCCAGGGSCE